MISGKFPSLKFSILSVVLLMSLFSFGLTWYSTNSFQQLTLEEYQLTVQKNLKQKTLELKRSLFSSQEIVANNILNATSLRKSLETGDLEAVKNILKQQFMLVDQFKIKSILLRDSGANLIAAAYEEGIEPYNGCPVMIDKIILGARETRFNSKFIICSQGNNPLAEVMVASGTQEPITFLHIVADLKNELMSMDKEIQLPVTLRSANNSLLYQSTNWGGVEQDDKILKPVSYTLFGDDNVPALFITTLLDHSSLLDKQQSSRLNVLRIAGILSAVAFVIVLLILLYAFKSVDLFRKSFGKLDHDRFVPIEKKNLPAELQDFASTYNQIIMVLDEATGNHLTAEKELRSERDFISKTLDSITNSVVVLNSALIIKLVNPAFEKLVGELEQDLVGHSFSNIMILYANRSVSHIFDLKQLVENPHQLFRLYYQKEDGVKELEMMASPMLDVHSEDIGFVLIFRDVTEGNELRRKLNFEGRHDKLTGLLNRVSFETKFDEIISDVYFSQSQHVLVTINIDNFSVISDSCGSDAGELLIKQVADILSHNVRRTDFLACLGGDDFGLILAYANMELAANTVSNILASICKTGFNWKGIEYPVTASAALISFGQINDDFDEVFSSLKAASYLAKQKGGNQYYLIGDNDVKVREHHENLKWVAKINEGFTEKRFKLYVQPIVPVHPNVGKPFYEVLIRYIAEDGKTILPDEFLGPAERFNLVEKIDRWVVSEVSHWLAENSKSSVDICFSINISEQSIRSTSFHRFIYQLLQANLVDAKKFCFETKDKTVEVDLDDSFEFIQNISSFGAKFSLDNFGRGLFSLANLMKIPADYLKIDGLIIKNLLKDNHSKVVARSIAEVGHCMGMKIIAESVESKEMLKILSDAKIDYLQGDAIGKPIPIESLDINRHWSI